MTEYQRDRVARHRAVVVETLYHMAGPFTVPHLAEAAGGQHLYNYASAAVRERVASGVVRLLDDECRPHLYELAPDE
jgi:hypothetical protein